MLRIDRLTADVANGIEALLLDLYRRLPPVRITHLLLEVDAALGFTDAFIICAPGYRVATGSACLTSSSPRG